jgi:hypothetical protein
MVLFLEITAFILTGLCVVHSITCRGREFTVLFFLGGFLLGILRENIVASFSDLYAYNPYLFSLWVGKAPLLLGVFWSYSFYFSLSAAEDLTKGRLMEGKKPAAVLLITMLAMAAFTCLNESFTSAYEMVLWKFRPAVMLWGTVPLLTLFGYAALALLFLLALRLVIGTRFSLPGKSAMIFLSILVIIPLHLAFLAAVRQMIRLAVA